MSVIRIATAVVFFVVVLGRMPVTHASWDPGSEMAFTRLLCADGEYFRDCFNSSKSTCEAAVRNKARLCNSGFMTAKRKSVKSEVQLFAEIGVCVGIALEKDWRDRKATTSKCDQKENWQ
jgi:hypothetical protein